MGLLNCGTYWYKTYIDRAITLPMHDVYWHDTNTRMHVQFLNQFRENSNLYGSGTWCGTYQYIFQKKNNKFII